MSMAVYRYLLQCNSCAENTLVFMGVGTAECEKFVYPCPYCTGAIHGIFRIDYKAPEAYLETASPRFRRNCRQFSLRSSPSRRPALHPLDLDEPGAGNHSIEC